MTHLPLKQALVNATKAAEKAMELWLESDAPQGSEEYETLLATSNVADEVRAAALEAFRDSNEPRLFELRDLGGSETITAVSLEDALEQAREWVERGDWDTSNGTVYVDVHVFGKDDETQDKVTVAIHQPEPKCSDKDGHDWQSPVEIVGGIKETPGVWGHGAGILMKECCMNCGCLRRTDTWAQRRDTGEQGFTETTYVEGFYNLSEYDAA